MLIRGNEHKQVCVCMYVCLHVYEQRLHGS